MPTVSAYGRTFSEAIGFTIRLFEIRLDERATEPIEVGYRLLPGTGGVATEALGNGETDVYGFLKGSVRFEPGEISKSIFRRIDRDDLPEDPETVILELKGVLNGADAQLAGGDEHTQGISWIYDNDSGPGSAFTAPEIIENSDGTVDVTFGIFSGASRGFPYSTVRTVDGTATAGTDYIAVEDYTAFTRTAFWGSASPKFYTVTILPDAKLEGPEDFYFEIDGTFTAIQTSDLFTIEDTPPPPLSLGSKQSRREVGTSGDDAVDLRTGADTYRAGAGDDIVLGGDGNDQIIGATGNDQLEGGRNFDFLRGGAGHDILHGDGGKDQLFGGIGDDILIGGAGSDVLVSGAGDDKLFDNRGNDVLRGGAGDDRVEGGVGDDRLFGGDGDDFIFGGGGNDFIGGGAGNDEIKGGRGDNVIDGGAGDDVISALSGDDILRGGAGNDLIFAGDGRDTVFGGDGDDELRVSERSRYGPNDDTLHGGAGNDLIVGSSRGGTTLIGGAGDDELRGGSRRDVLIGGDGNDILNGGGGGDSLAGGRNSDVFMFSRNGGGDTIEDFDVEEDLIDLTLLNDFNGRFGRPTYEFGGALSLSEGLGMGPGTLWVTDAGDSTWLYGQLNKDNRLDFSLLIEDGTEFSASDYTAENFIL